MWTLTSTTERKIDLMKKLNNGCDSIEQEGGSSSNGLKVLEALNSKYTSLYEPLPSRPENNNLNGKRYLTSLRVYGNREVDDNDAVEPPHSPLPASFSKLLDDQNIIDQQRINEKIIHALSDLSFRDPHVLVQFWSPATVRKRCLLTTLDQPFGLGVVDEGLYLYRLKSEQRIFVVDGEHREDLGPPGRVYCRKLPEWSLDVHTLPTRKSVQDLAACYNIHGYINLPVFEPDSGCCVGVLEIITSSNYVDYTFEVREVARALKEQNLKSPNVFEDHCFYVGDGRNQHEMDEIFSTLKAVCDVQNIPLAQTWALSEYTSVVANCGNLEQSCSSYKKSCIGKVCMSTSGLPFYVRDLSMWGFHEASRERHLDISQGLVGKSLSSRGLCFCEDVTKLGEDLYPLGSYARANRITSSLAIYLKSIKREVEYVIELVLPPHTANEAGVQSLVNIVKQRIKNVFCVKLGIMSSLQVISRDPLDWKLESPPSPVPLLTEKGEVPPEPGNPPSPITLLTEKGEVPPEPVNPSSLITVLSGKREESGNPQPLLEYERNVDDFNYSKDQNVVAYVEDMENINLENEPSNAAAGTSQSVVPCLETVIEDDITKGKPINKYKDYSKDQSVVAYVEDMENDNLENQTSNIAAAAGTSQSVVPRLETMIEDDINNGKPIKKYKDNSNKQIRKRKRTERSITLEEISKHYGKTMEEAAVSLRVSRSTLKRICRGLGVSRWPYKAGDSVIKSNQGVVAIHKPERAFTPFLGTSSEPLGPTNITYAPVTLTEHVENSSALVFHQQEQTNRTTHDPATLTNDGKQSSTLVLRQQEHTNLPDEHAQPLTTIRDQYAENALAANTVKNVTIKATYKENTVKFPYVLTDGLVKLEELVATRFQLERGSFSLKYEDEDGDKILIACDTDLLGSLGDNKQEDDQTVIRLLVTPVVHQSPDAY